MQDPSNAYQRYLQQQNFSAQWDPSAYQTLLAQQQATRSVQSQVAQHSSQLQAQAQAQHAHQLQQSLQRHGVDAQHYDQQIGAVSTHKGIGQVNLEQVEQQRKGATQVTSSARPNIEFHKLEPEQFRLYTLYYKPDCPHSINLLSRLAKDPLLDSKVTRINIEQYRVAGLQGVPTLVDDRKQVYLGSDALRWVESKASQDIIGMDLQDVSGAPTSAGLAPSDAGTEFAFVHDSLLNMPQISSLQQVDTREQRGPQIDSVMKTIESQRQQFLRPYADPGNLTPPAPPPQVSAMPPQGRPKAAVSAPQSSVPLHRAQMNPSQKAQKNAGYEMDRAAIMGDGNSYKRYQ
jgi:hypothetical protein